MAAVNLEENHEPPLLDEAVLARLREELDEDDGIWKVFVQDFIAQLLPRIERLRSTLTTGDAKGALDAVLSLKTSAQMVGAMQLAGLALELEQSIRRAATGSDPAAVLPGLAARHLRRLSRCAQRTKFQLEAVLR